MGNWVSGVVELTEHQQVCRLPEGTCLDSFIQNNIQALRDFVTSAQTSINNVVRILHSWAFPYHVAEVFKTGSLGQGTALKGNLSDIDLVIYLNNHTVETMTENIDEILTKMAKALEGLPGYKCISKDKFRLGIQLEVQNQNFEVDLLPGIAVSGSPKRMYEMMHSESRWIQAHYSVSFAKLQKMFVSTRETKLKNLFQLMKYWSKVDLKQFTSQKVPSYLMCLIVIHTWEEYGKPQNFKTEIGFKAVLTTLVNYRYIQKVWFENYDRYMWQCFGVPNTPYLMDPANPSSNMLNTVDWTGIVQAAKNTIDSPLLAPFHISPNWR